MVYDPLPPTLVMVKFNKLPVKEVMSPSKKLLLVLETAYARIRCPFVNAVSVDRRFVVNPTVSPTSSNPPSMTILSLEVSP
jgi:hypothetical protein